MNENLKQSIDLFMENEKILQDKFGIYGADKNAVCALEYSAKGMSADVDKVKAATEIINNKAGLLSDFFGSTYLILATQMAQADDLEAYFDQVEAVYNLLAKGKWIGGGHYVVAAMMIVQNAKGDLELAQEYVKKTLSIHSRMSENHPWITSLEDMGFATLLAVSGLEEDAVVDEMEKCFKQLKQANIGSSNGIQSLSHILSLSIGNSEQKCEKVIAINEALKKQNRYIGRSVELSILGGLALTDADAQTIAREIVEADEYIYANRGPFGSLGLGKQERLMYSVIFVMQQHAPKAVNDAAAIASMVSVVIATQVAVMMMINMNLMMMNVSH